MSQIDWIILVSTLLLIILYGLWKGRGQSGSETYLRAGREMKWHVVLLGIMATQASAITFISGPGQAYQDGMRFVQYYFGLPIAMIVISAVFVPIFQRLNVYTAYEYLDKRFDRKTRLFTSILFLFSRGVSTGISIYAPAIILSTIFGWNIYITNILTGGLLIIYTYTGGAKAIAHTQKIQFTIILISMAIAGFMVVKLLPEGIGFMDALYIAGKSEKLNVITTDIDFKDKYNLFSGIIGGFFLALSYFGTDQSQVGRYLTGKSIKESRLGLLMNGMVKIPMQFLILLMGALLFSFYTFHKAPVFFNESADAKTSTRLAEKYIPIKEAHDKAVNQNQIIAFDLINAYKNKDQIEEENLISQLKKNNLEIKKQREEISAVIKNNQALIGESPKDDNYIFLHFVTNYLPSGMTGLLFAIVFLASWGSISAALNSLASSSLIDFHQVFRKKEMNQRQELKFGRIHTLIWGIFGIAVAMFATQMGSLIEAVNELGSLFYGAILGIFLTAFFLKNVKGKAVFVAALLSELIVVLFYVFNWVAFLWLNVIGALCVMIISYIYQIYINAKTNK